MEFSGRQDDVQGKMDLHGNWITGINTLDSYLLGVNQADLPSDVLNNKARNTYFFTSFNFWFNRIFIRFQKDKKIFWSMLVFSFLLVSQFRCTQMLGHLNLEREIIRL